MTAGVTIQQARCLEAIKAYIAAHGCSPSYDELRVSVGVASRGGVHRLLSELRRRGLITFDHHARSIRIVEGPTREAMLAWSEAEFERVAAVIRSIDRERQIARANRRADTILAEAR